MLKSHGDRFTTSWAQNIDLQMVIDAVGVENMATWEVLTFGSRFHLLVARQTAE